MRQYAEKHPSAISLLRQPLGSDGAALGPPAKLRVRRGSVGGGAAAAGDNTWEMREEGVEGHEWTPVSLGAWEAGSRSFRALVGESSVQGSALLRAAAGGDDARVSVWVGGESVSVAVRAHSAPRLPRRSPMPAVLPGPALYPPPYPSP